MIPLTLSRRGDAGARRTGRRRVRTLVVAASSAIAVAAAPSRVGAQILKVPKNTREPIVWGSVGVGYYQMNDVVDGRTETGWRFGSGAQYRGSVEYSIGRATSVGVAGTYAHLPMRYVYLTDSAASANGVGSRSAHAAVSSLMATFHSGGGVGFHYVFDAGVGVTRFGSFKADNTGAALAPGGDTDFAFSVGTGFGYSASPTTEFFLVQEYGNTIHQRDNLPSDARTNVQQLTTRVGVRYGAGPRRAR